MTSSTTTHSKTTHLVRFCLGALTLVCLTACFGPQEIFEHFDPPAEPTPQQTDSPPLSCTSFSLATDTATPFEAIDITWDSSRQPTFAVAHINNTGGLAAVEHVEGSWKLTAPLSGKIYEASTATVQVYIFDDAQVAKCPAVDLNITGLPKAPGTTKRALTIIKDIIELRAKSMGVDVNTLRSASWDALPVQLHGPSKALFMIDGPDNEMSLTRLLNDSSIWSPEAIEFTDAVLAHGGYLKELKAHRANQSKILAEASVPMMRRQILTQPQVSGLSDDCGLKQHLSVDIRTTAELSDRMRQAHRNLLWTKDKHFNLASTVVDQVGTLPGGVIKAATGVTGVLLYTDKYISEAYAHTMPTHLYDPQLNSWTRDMLEDTETPGEWSEYTIRAKSKGWSANAAIRDGLLTVYNLTPLAGSGVAKVGKALVPKAIQDMALNRKWLSELATNRTVLYIQNNAKRVSDKEFAKQNMAQEKGKGAWCYVPPQTWGRFDIGAYHHSRTQHHGAIKGDNTHHHRYHAAAQSDGTLEMRAFEERFPPKSNTKSSAMEIPVTVHRIEVSVAPKRQRIKAGETLELTATVRYAEDTRVTWTLIEGEGVTLVNNYDNTATLTIPKGYSSDDLVVVRARSIANTGIRRGQIDTDPRDDFALFAVDGIEDITLSPTTSCISTGESVTFDWTISGTDTTPTWHATGGTISPSGVFTGTTKGEHTVTLTSAAFPDVQKQATVIVDDQGCRCHWSTSVTGVVFHSFGGRKGVQGTTLGERLNLTMEDSHGNGLTLVVTGEGPSALAARLPGEYLAMGSVMLADSDNLSQSHTSVSKPPKLVITHWEGNHIRGYYEAEVTVLGTAVLPLGEQIKSKVRADFSTYITEGLNPTSWIGPNCLE